MYRTLNRLIRPHSKLHMYSKNLCFYSARLYNRANFIVRNFATAVTKFSRFEPLTANELEIFSLVHRTLDGTKYEPVANTKWLNRFALEFLLRKTKDESYYSLPAQSSIQIIGLLMQDYKSYFESIKCYKENPSAFTGRPRMPHYKGKEAEMTTIITNQDCVIKNNRYLKLPKTKNRMNIGEMPDGAVLKEVRITPCGNSHNMQVVIEIADEGLVYEEAVDTDQLILSKYADVTDASDIRIMSIDPGLNNFCTVTNNVGFSPFIINGKPLKAVNQLYNKELAKAKSQAEICNKTKSTKYIRNLTSKRNRRIKDMMHKISKYLTDYAVEHGIQLVVFGHNKMQKQDVSLGKKNNQNFVQIPTLMFINMLRYKLNAQGIEFVCIEESYTSKADFKAMDEIPVYGVNDKDANFSGSRIKRGLYRHADGTVSNADINGSANIMRKVFPKVRQWDSGCMDHPYVVTIA